LNCSLEIYRALGDKLGEADALNWLAIDHSDIARTRGYLEASLAIDRELGHWAGVAASLTSLAQIASWEGEYEKALPWLEEAMRLQRQLGSNAGAAWVLEIHANLAMRRGDYERALALYTESLALTEAAGLHNYWTLANQAYIAARQGDAGRARALFANAIQRFREAQIRIGIVYCVEGLSSLAAAQGQLERAATLLGWAESMRELIGDKRPSGEDRDLEHGLAPVRTGLPPAAFAAAYAAGEEMTTDKAVALALEP
jgi:tetratricopeptide (TPR) repeat protein